MIATPLTTSNMVSFVGYANSLSSQSVKAISIVRSGSLCDVRPETQAKERNTTPWSVTMDRGKVCNKALSRARFAYIELHETRI
jgi:hypothetical protein